MELLWFYVAIALAMYCAERIGGEFKDYFITFSNHPELIKIEGIDFVDKKQNDRVTILNKLYMNLLMNGFKM